MKTPATVSGSSAGAAMTERPLLVHSGMNRAISGATSLAATRRATPIGSRQKLSLSTRTISSRRSSVAIEYRNPASSCKTRDPDVDFGMVATVAQSRGRAQESIRKHACAWELPPNKALQADAEQPRFSARGLRRSFLRGTGPAYASAARRS